MRVASRGINVGSALPNLLKLPNLPKFSIISALGYNGLRWVKMFLSRKKFKTLRHLRPLCHLYPLSPSDRFLGGEEVLIFYKCRVIFVLRVSKYYLINRNSVTIIFVCRYYLNAVDTISIQIIDSQQFSLRLS